MVSYTIPYIYLDDGRNGGILLYVLSTLVEFLAEEANIDSSLCMWGNTHHDVLLKLHCFS